jgi:hypothetical protein
VLLRRDAIVENSQSQDPATVAARLGIGDETHVCVGGKFSGIMIGTDRLRGNNQLFTTYECPNSPSRSPSCQSSEAYGHARASKHQRPYWYP